MLGDSAPSDAAHEAKVSESHGVVASGDELVLEPLGTPRERFTGVGRTLLIWAVMLVAGGLVLYDDWIHARLGLGCQVTLGAFFLLGIVQIPLAGFRLRALFSPWPRISLDSRRVEPGSERLVRLHWEGKMSRLREVTVEVEGQEIIAHRDELEGLGPEGLRGLFRYQQVLLNEGEPIEPGHDLPLIIPRDARPSRRGGALVSVGSCGRSRSMASFPTGPTSARPFR